MRQSVVLREKPLSFSDYYRINADIEDIVAHFGYGFDVKKCVLPRQIVPQDLVETLQARLERSLYHLTLSSEAARREFFIAPILLEVAFYTHTKIKVEYPLHVSEQLKGTLDYLLQGQNRLLVVEAKNADLQRGLTQLLTELIALDAWIEDEAPILYGAVSMGDIWRFALLERPSKQLWQDIELYRVPADLNDLLQILVGILGD